MKMKEGIKLNLKEIGSVLTLVMVILVGAGALVRYNTSDINAKMERTDERLSNMQKEIDSKANAGEVEIMFRNILTRIEELKQQFEETRKEIKQDLKDLRK